MKIDHDLLMIIYGALIGVGASIITTLFQSWINRREREQQRREEKKREQQKVYIPTQAEVKEILERPRASKGISWPLLLTLLLCAVILNLISWIDEPIFYLVIPGVFAFIITYFVLKNAQNI